MNVSLFARAKNFLQKLWGAWSAVQDREDGVFRSETGIGKEPEGSERKSEGSGCATSDDGNAQSANDVVALSDLIRQRNAESAHSQDDGEKE
ncbi:hypothetical protein JYT90_00580 [bacterium AH-315-P07]|nr:hypothetical protein [bacterium AH-315-P07]